MVRPALEMYSLRTRVSSTPLRCNKSSHDLLDNIVLLFGKERWMSKQICGALEAAYDFFHGGEALAQWSCKSMGDHSIDEALSDDRAVVITRPDGSAVVSYRGRIT